LESFDTAERDIRRREKAKKRVIEREGERERKRGMRGKAAYGARYRSATRRSITSTVSTRQSLSSTDNIRVNLAG
jgi:hypothetical protein